MTISLFSHRTPQVFFKSCCCHELKTGNKRITNLSFISLHRVDEKNIFTNRKPVTLYLQNKLHENTALVAGSILFFYLSKLLKKISYFLSREANKKVIATVFEGLKLRQTMPLTLVAKLRRSRGRLIHFRSELIRRVREK